MSKRLFWTKSRLSFKISTYFVRFFHSWVSIIIFSLSNFVETTELIRKTRKVSNDWRRWTFIALIMFVFYERVINSTFVNMKVNLDECHQEDWETISKTFEIFEQISCLHEQYDNKDMICSWNFLWKFTCELNQRKSDCIKRKSKVLAFVLRFTRQKFSHVRIRMNRCALFTITMSNRINTISNQCLLIRMQASWWLWITMWRFESQWRDCKTISTRLSMMTEKKCQDNWKRKYIHIVRWDFTNLKLWKIFRIHN